MRGTTLVIIFIVNVSYHNSHVTLRITYIQTDLVDRQTDRHTRTDVGTCIHVKPLENCHITGTRLEHFLDAEDYLETPKVVPVICSDISTTHSMPLVVISSKRSDIKNERGEIRTILYVRPCHRTLHFQSRFPFVI